MSLIFRMLWLLVAAAFKPCIPMDRLQNRLTLRVLPNDLDINLHMNNGRYLTICDLSRVDLFIRTGLARTMLKEGWIPVIAEHSMRYKKPLHLFERYEVEMEVTGWDEKYFHMVHRFRIGDRIIAEGASSGCVFSRKEGVMAPERVIARVLELTGAEPTT